MTRLTILTNGCYPQCDDCIGRIVEGEAFINSKEDIAGYDVPITEMIRVGATFVASEWEHDATIFFATFYDIPEIEVTQDEYR